jgi:hypothetical protein
MGRKSEVKVGGYQPRVLSYMVRRRYQETTSEDLEDSAFAAVICRMCRLVKVLHLFVVKSYKLSINPIVNPSLVSGL